MRLLLESKLPLTAGWRPGRPCLFPHTWFDDTRGQPLRGVYSVYVTSKE